MDRFVALADKVSAVLSLGGWDVVPVRAARGDETRVYVSQETGQIILSDRAWTTLGFDSEALDQFFDTAIEMTGVWDLSASTFWGKAVRAQARVAEEQAHVKSVDRLSDVTTRVERLLTEAASMNSTGHSAQSLSIYTERYAELNAELATLQREVARAMGLLDVAREAVLEAVA